MKAIGIDIGTTTISAVVLDAERKKVLESRTVENGSFLKTDHDWERIQNVSVIIDKAERLLEELLGICQDVGAIGLTGQMHGILYTDEEGHCVSPLYTWQDRRGDLPEFEGKSMTEQIKEKTGLALAAGYGLVTHLYNCQKGLVPREACSLCTVGDYLGMRLTGRRSPLMHSSNGGSLGFFDLQKGDFFRDILEETGMAMTMLPAVTEKVELLGSYRGIPVTVALGDNQASFLGSVGMREETLLLNVGTGGQISVLSDRCFEVPGIESRPFVEGKYLLVGASLCGGRAYAILERFFRSYLKEATGLEKSQYEVMARLAEKGKKDGERMQVSTTFRGTRDCPGERGRITGLDEDNFTPEGLVYGTLEGMAGELYEMYEKIYRGTGIRASHLVASGNGVRKNRVLQEIFRELFDADLELAPYEEEAACGAAVSGIKAKERRKKCQ